MVIPNPTLPSTKNIKKLQCRPSKSRKSSKNTDVHLGELVRGATGDLGNAEEGELGLEFLQLGQKVGLRLLAQLVHLDPRSDLGFTRSSRG